MTAKRTDVVYEIPKAISLNNKTDTTDRQKIRTTSTRSTAIQTDCSRQIDGPRLTSPHIASFVCTQQQRAQALARTTRIYNHRDAQQHATNTHNTQHTRHNTTAGAGRTDHQTWFLCRGAAQGARLRLARQFEALVCWMMRWTPCVFERMLIYTRCVPRLVYIVYSRLYCYV